MAVSQRGGAVVDWSPAHLVGGLTDQSTHISPPELTALSDAELPGVCVCVQGSELADTVAMPTCQAHHDSDHCSRGVVRTTAG